MGLDVAILEVDGKPAFQPSASATFVVAVVLARCADKRSDLFVSRDLFSDGFHDHPPLRGLIECEVCGIWAAHTY